MKLLEIWDNTKSGGLKYYNEIKFLWYFDIGSDSSPQNFLKIELYFATSNGANELSTQNASTNSSWFLFVALHLIKLL